MQQIRRPVRNVEEARQLLNEMADRRVSLAAFAREKGVDGRSLNMYRLNLESSVDRPEPLRVVEWVASTPTTPSSTRYMVRCGALAIEVDDQFDDAVLRRLLAVVASC